MKFIVSTAFLAVTCVLAIAAAQVTTRPTTKALTTTAFPEARSEASTFDPGTADPLLTRRLSVNLKSYTTSLKTKGNPVVVRGQETEKDLNSILDQVAQTSVELEKVEKKMEALKPRIINYKQRLDAHNTEKCIYPEGQPEVCKDFEARRAKLEQDRDVLKAEYAEIEKDTGILKSQWGMHKARIRIITMLLYCSECKDRDLEPEEETACWSQCFEHANPSLKKCLDMPPSSVYVCLYKLRHP
jgi:hypothetical protein